MNKLPPSRNKGITTSPSKLSVSEKPSRKLPSNSGEFWSELMCCSAWEDCPRACKIIKEHGKQINGIRGSGEYFVKIMSSSQNTKTSHLLNNWKCDFLNHPSNYHVVCVWTFDTFNYMNHVVIPLPCHEHELPTQPKRHWPYNLEQIFRQSIKFSTLILEEKLRKRILLKVEIY